MAADGGLALDQEDLLAGVGEGHRRVDARDAAADHQHIGMDRHFLHFERLVMGHALDCGARERLGFLGGFLAVGVHPRVVLADVDHVEEERVQPAGLGGAPEGVLVQERRTGGNDDAVELELADVLLDELLARVRAHVLVVAGKGHARQLLDVFRDLGAIHHRRNIVAAMADVETDANLTISLLFHHQIQDFAVRTSLASGFGWRRLLRPPRPLWPEALRSAAT